MLVGFGVDADLREHRLGLSDVGGDEMLAGSLTVFAAALGFAVQGDDQFFAWRQARGDPTGKLSLEDVDVQDAKYFGQGGLGGSLAASEAKGVGQRKSFITSELGDGRKTLGAGKHGKYRHR